MMEIKLCVDTGQRSRPGGMKAAYAVVDGPSSGDIITSKESWRFPEIPALPPLVSMHNIIGCNSMS